MRIKSLLVLILAITFAVSPFFVTSFMGIDPDLFPVPQVDPPVQPAGWAFAIWSLIYVWLIVHGGFGVWKRPEDPLWDRTRLPLIGSLLIGTFWLWAAERSAILSTAMIWAMLALAVWALLASPRQKDRWLLSVPLSIYAGWLTAASCAALGLLGAGWGIGPGELGWAWIGIAVASVIALAVQWARPDAPGYGLTVAWALVAIAVKNLGAQNGVAAFAVLATVAILALAGRGFVSRERRATP
jgi:hypothetical protein